jgi:deoxyribose-phosphate aldolase
MTKKKAKKATKIFSDETMGLVKTGTGVIGGGAAAW